MSISMGRSILTLVSQSSALRSTQLLSELPFVNLFASIQLTSPQHKICLTNVGRSFTDTSSTRSLISPTNRIGSSSSVSDTLRLDGLAALAAVESSKSRVPPPPGGLNGIAALAAATVVVASSSATDSPTMCEGEEIDDEDDEEVVLLSPSARQKNAEGRQGNKTLCPLCLCYINIISFAHTITCILFCFRTGYSDEYSLTRRYAESVSKVIEDIRGCKEALGYCEGFEVQGWHICLLELPLFTLEGT